MTELVVSFEVDGLHCWPGAPDKYKEFRQPHRHIFKIICLFPTEDSHDPERRDTELWELRRQAIDSVHTHWGQEPVNFGGMSCEGIADRLKDLLFASKVFVGEEYYLGAWVS